MAGARPAAVAYALPALPLAALTLPTFIHLPAFYGDTLGLGLATVGAVLLAARLVDAASDPLIGWLGDRTRSRFGRRRPWIAAGVAPTMLAAWQLFVPPAGAGIGHLLAWSLVLYLGWSMMTLPYQAWGAEQTGDYHERSRIAGWREAMTVAGTLLAAGIPAILGLAGDPGASLAVVGALVVILLPLATAVALWRVPEPQAGPAIAAGWRRGARLLLGNGPFRRLLAAYVANGLANGLPATLFLLFVGHRLAAPELAGPLLLAYFVGGLAGVPLWLALSRRVGKHRAWSIAMIVACGAFAWVPLLGPGDAGFFLAICIVTGLTLGADLVLPGAIQADVVDLDTARGGGGRAGIYFALWGMATKLALALAVGIAFPLLGSAGFVAAAADQPPGALATLALLYGAAPVLFKAAAVLLMWRFPLTEAVQRRLQRRIAASDPSPPEPGHAPSADPRDRLPAGRMQPHEA